MNRAWLAAAAAAVLLLTNLVALGGAWWNRQGTPESELLLSERELTPPYWMPSSDENSGLALHLDVRVAPAPGVDMPGGWMEHNAHGHEAPWLDEAKLRALGFDLPPITDDTPEPHWRRPLLREVWLALEFDGPAHQQHIAAADAWASWVRNASEKDIAEKLYGQRPDEGEIQRTLTAVRETSSRLYVIDADRDAEALRARYPNRTRYAIVSGRIRADHRIAIDGKPAHWLGNVQEIDILDLHVSTAWREAVQAIVDRRHENDGTLRFTARIAWGKRHEPWIVDLQPDASMAR